jgi:hypothetical protein
MNWLLGYYLLQAVLIVVILVLSVLFWDKRYKKGEANDNIPEGFIKTAEVSIDPQTKEKQRVYYRPDTGERIYRIEGEREDGRGESG